MSPLSVIVSASSRNPSTEFFDVGESRSVAWARRPQAAALVVQLADPGRGRDAIAVGEYERRSTAPSTRSWPRCFEHYGVQLWLPEAGGRVDFASEHDALGLSSKREVIRTSIRVRTAMAVHTRDQGRYLGGRPPYGYRLADAGPHPNKAHAAAGGAIRYVPADGTSATRASLAAIRDDPDAFQGGCQGANPG
jgi:site-specific DNA recombinase